MTPLPVGVRLTCVQCLDLHAVAGVAVAGCGGQAMEEEVGSRWCCGVVAGVQRTALSDAQGTGEGAVTAGTGWAVAQGGGWCMIA